MLNLVDLSQIWTLPVESTYFSRKRAAVSASECALLMSLFPPSSVFWTSLECQTAMPICILFAHPSTQPAIDCQSSNIKCFLCPSTVLSSVDTVLNRNRHFPCSHLTYILVKKKGQINEQDHFKQWKVILRKQENRMRLQNMLMRRGYSVRGVRLGLLGEVTPELRLERQEEPSHAKVWSRLFSQ